MEKELELILYVSQCLSLILKPSPSLLVFPVLEDRANSVTQIQEREAKKAHAPDTTSRVRTTLLCAVGQNHRYAHLPELGLGQPFQLLFQACSPGFRTPGILPVSCTVQLLHLAPPALLSGCSQTTPLHKGRIVLVPQPQAQRPAQRRHSIQTGSPGSCATLNSGKLIAGYDLQNATNREGIYSQFKENY